MIRRITSRPRRTALRHRPARRPGAAGGRLRHPARRDGHELIFLPFTNYTERNHEIILEMMKDDQSLFGLGDGGAHCGLICDATIPTYLLTHWVRDRNRGERLPLEWIVKRQTRDNAEFFGLHDRGTLASAEGDVNVIDFERLTLKPPHIVHDLPAGRSTPGAKGRGLSGNHPIGPGHLRAGCP